MNEFDILILGGGPTADSFLSVFQNRNIRIGLVCPKVELKENTFRFSNSLKSDLWKHIGGSDYTVSKTPYKYIPEISQLDIKARGGLARHWGGGIAVLTAEETGVPKDIHNQLNC